MSNALTNRLGKELSQLAASPPEGVSVDAACASNLRQWAVHVQGAPSTLYAGERYTLQFTFPEQYPFSSPEVVFVGDNIPVHPHVYSNGHICLSILTEDWTPALSVQSVCLSILSMLSSSKEKVHHPPSTPTSTPTATSASPSSPRTGPPRSVSSPSASPSSPCSPLPKRRSTTLPPPPRLLQRPHLPLHPHRGLDPRTQCPVRLPLHPLLFQREGPLPTSLPDEATGF